MAAVVSVEGLILAVQCTLVHFLRLLQLALITVEEP
jgi:hypothetical protein